MFLGDVMPFVVLISCNVFHLSLLLLSLLFMYCVLFLVISLLSVAFAFLYANQSFMLSDVLPCGGVCVAGIFGV